MKKETIDIPTLLAGGDRRSIGRANAVACRVLKEPSLFPGLFECLSSGDEVVRMRAADAAEKVTRERPEFLRKFNKKLLALAAASEQQEVRWHVAQMVPRLDLSAAERRRAMDLLKEWATSPVSAIVRVNSLQAMADLAAVHGRHRGEVMRLLAEAKATGSPAVKNRAARLLTLLGGDA